jgi:hypothetical protein
MIKPLAVTAAGLLLCGCATSHGLNSYTSTVFGIQVDTSVNSIPTFKAGLIRTEIITVSSNDLAGAEIVKASEVESIGFLRNRVHTVLAVGNIAVAQPSVGQPMPAPSAISTNQP